ncbi:MAG: hypothetical protein JXA69_15750 [Phycisphaerae bacterium]|nr:hypothetical protein [Phycisphaerae bacterium]
MCPIRTVIAGTCILAVLMASPAWAVTRIMPLGDSITVGLYDSPVEGGYRGPLYASLVNAGHVFDLAGSQNTWSGAIPDPNHEGHSGYEAELIRDGVTDWLNLNPPDIILLHIGTNDVSWNDPNSTITTEIGQILDNIDAFEAAHDKVITVVLARIINRNDSKSATTTALNVAIATMAAARIAAGDRIVVVDQESALSYPADLHDTVHPNHSGYGKMATVWYNALIPLLPVPVRINQAAGQVDPTNGSAIHFTVVFNESMSGFETGDVTITGTAGGTKTATVTGSGTTYDVAVTGMTSSGTVIARIPAGVALGVSGNSNAESISTDNVVVYDITPPTVTINQAAGQVDPSNGPVIHFTAFFSESVSGFTNGDVTITGTAGGTKTAVVTGGGTTYEVAVSGMTSSGTVIVTIVAGGATDIAGNGNTASTSTDNTVSFNAPPPAPMLISPADGASGLSVTLTLEASAFFDVDGDTHANSHWQVADTNTFADPLWDSGDGFVASTQATVPLGTLPGLTRCHWRTRYRDSRGAWTAWSSSRHFETGVDADLDDDGDVDLADFGSFSFCFNGPNRPLPVAGCAVSDLDADSDVDLTDFALFAARFNGPNRAPREP